MKTHRLTHVSKAMISTILFASLQFACTKKEESGTVRIVLPSTPTTAAVSAKAGSASTVGAQSVSASSEGSSFNSNINPITGSDINCFAVFIGGGDLGANSCTVGTSAADATTIKFGPNIGFIPAGTAISLDTPPGQRMIYVIGLRAATTAACSNYASGTDDANLSEPFLIASQSANIVSGANTVAITAALNTSKKVLDCQFLNPGGTGGGFKSFGDKRDGSIDAISPGSAMTAGTATLASATARSGTSSLPNSKIFGASRRISSIASTGADPGRAIATSSTFNSDEFAQGDEVAWYVAGGQSSLGSPDDPVLGACGGGLYLGRFGVTRIKSISGSNGMILEQSVSGSPGTIRSTSLNQPPTAADYCTVVIARVSSFDSITVGSGNNLTMSAQAFNYANGDGGIVMIRAETISVAAGSTLTVTGYAGGFGGGVAAGTRYQGQGVNGFGTTTTNANYNGGAPGDSSAIGGGGGGHASAGANGVGVSGSTGLGGAPLNHCSGSLVCKPLEDQKTFMGGGGGGAGGSGQGGNGGGIVLVYARTMTGLGTVNIRADGQDGAISATGAGGGAGGTVGLVVQSRPILTLNLYAKGGNGGATAANGGGGGGGVVNLWRCSTNPAGNNFGVSVVGGTGGSTTAATGLSAINNTAACGLQ